MPKDTQVTPTPDGGLIAGAPGAYIPPVGTGTPTSGTDASEGERVLEQEGKAQRAGTDIQRG